jgi:hypothetical protein
MKWLRIRLRSVRMSERENYITKSTLFKGGAGKQLAGVGAKFSET